MEEIEQLLNEQMQIELTSEGKEIEEKFKNIEEEIFNLKLRISIISEEQLSELFSKERNERIMRKIDEMEFLKKVTFIKEPSNEEELLLQIAEGITKLNENMIKMENEIKKAL
ncbi:hypothetical protein RhiirA5_354624 [Rhizophagus irregularis]|uniref:Uncharacterized protein n=1 Tax=Rhizophagus irregularis TaxID=588596 RepID=A0A2N0PWF4_9GLOM|nr:hypothetical protein RhiirA5_354624 [Rhizophagus irregularis]